MIVGDNNFWYAYGEADAKEVEKVALKDLRYVKKTIKANGYSDDESLGSPGTLYVFIGKQIKSITL